jgi:hypothetical protein
MTVPLQGRGDARRTVGDQNDLRRQCTFFSAVSAPSGEGAGCPTGTCPLMATEVSQRPAMLDSWSLQLSATLPSTPASSTDSESPI